MTKTNNAGQDVATSMSLLNWLGVIGAALTLLGFLDRSVSLAKWADRLIQNWLLLNKAIWGTLLWFLPPPSVFDANALTLLVFIANAMWASSVPRGPATERSWRAWGLVALGGLVVASTVAQQSYAYYRLESSVAYDCSARTDMKVLLGTGPTTISRKEQLAKCLEQSKLRVGYFAQVTDSLRTQIDQVSPYKACSSVFLGQVREAFARHKEQNPDDALTSETQWKIMSEAGFIPVPRCQSDQDYWWLVVSPTGALMLMPFLFLSIATVIPGLLIRRVFNRTLSPHHLATRIWLVIVFAASIVAINFLAVHAQDWFKAFGINLPS